MLKRLMVDVSIYNSCSTVKTMNPAVEYVSSEERSSNSNNNNVVIKGAGKAIITVRVTYPAE